MLVTQNGDNSFASRQVVEERAYHAVAHVLEI